MFLNFFLVGKTKRGELSIFPRSFVVLSHCLHMMPRQKAGPSLEATNVKVKHVMIGLLWSIFPECIITLTSLEVLMEFLFSRSRKLKYGFQELPGILKHTFWRTRYSIHWKCCLTNYIYKLFNCSCEFTPWNFRISWKV